MEARGVGRAVAHASRGEGNPPPTTNSADATAHTPARCLEGGGVILRQPVRVLYITVRNFDSA
jgi:hypothetical protein